MRTNLTDAFIRAIEPPPAGQCTYFDARMPGLGLRVSCGGTKRWVIVYRLRGRVRWLSLGKFPVFGLADARALAKKRLAEVATGADPAQEKQEAQREATFEALAARYIDDGRLRKRANSAYQDEGLLRRYVPEGWGKRRLSDLERADFERLHAQVGAEHGKSAANHLLRLVRHMLNCAKDWALLKAENPAARIKLFKEQRHERYLSADELRRVNAALREEPNPYWRAFFALSLLTGCRRGELLSATWEQINLGERTLRLPVTKAGREHLVPLSEAALAILSSLPGREAGGYVFPSASKHGHLTEPKAAWRRICARAEVSNCRVHDLRHSVASLLIQSGYGIALIGRVLNHSQLSTTERYSHLSLANMRDALEHVGALVNGSASDVSVGEIGRAAEPRPRNG